MASQTEMTTSQLPGATGTALAGPAAAAPKGKRLLFIDNLRILLICMVLVQHLSDTYGAAGSWMYRDPATADTSTSTFLTVLNGIGMAAGMGFFFLLAGYFTPRSYDRKGGAASPGQPGAVKDKTDKEKFLRANKTGASGDSPYVRNVLIL